MDIDRAISQGIDSARHHRKDGAAPYNQYHPLFKAWWEAVVLKADLPFMSDNEIHQRVKQTMRKR